MVVDNCKDSFTIRRLIKPIKLFSTPYLLLFILMAIKIYLNVAKIDYDNLDVFIFPKKLFLCSNCMLMRIVAFHVLNDFSGSPKVLKQLLNAWQLNEMKVVLFTNHTKGFLSNLNNVEYHFFPYQFYSNTLIRIFYFFYSQFILFFKALFFLKKDDIVYCNTILPFAGALAGKIRGAKIIYHIHETNTNKKLLDVLLNFIIKITATKIIYVSKFVASHYDFNTDQRIIPNSIEADFIVHSRKLRQPKSTLKNVLMVCSLKEYKGINEYVQIAALNPHLDFVMVINDTEEKLNEYFKNTKPLANLLMYPKQTNVHPFYLKADVVLNLTRVDMACETFGLTVIEAMTYGLPVIVPPIGGIAELVIDGENGFKVDSRQIDELSKKLNKIFDPELYKNMSAAQFKLKPNYDESKFIEQNISFITSN